MSRHLGYVAIEGAIGAGKAALAKALAPRLNARLVLEEPSANPFLDDFYDDRPRWALHTQLAFLLARHQALAPIAAAEEERNRTLLTDFLVAKDQIFARATLDARELALYEEIATGLRMRGPTPDLIIYLQATTDLLMHHLDVARRIGEREIPREYLDALNDAYNHFFFHFTDAPLLVINVNEVDPVESPGELDAILERIREHPGGTVFYSPARGVRDAG